MNLLPKRIIALLLTLFILFVAAACDGMSDKLSSQPDGTPGGSNSDNSPSQPDSTDDGSKQTDAVLSIVIGGEVAVVINMDDLNEIGVTDVVANYKPSTQPEPVDVVFSGVSFAALLNYAGIDPAGFTVASFIADDGYASALPIGDALNAESCWIVTAEEGAPLPVRGQEGAKGPYMMVLAKDQFSQRWCKFLKEINLS